MTHLIPHMFTPTSIPRSASAAICTTPARAAARIAWSSANLNPASRLAAKTPRIPSRSPRHIAWLPLTTPVVTVGITSTTDYVDVPRNVLMKLSNSVLPKDSVICVAHLTSLDRVRFKDKIDGLSTMHLDQVEYGIALVLDLK